MTTRRGVWVIDSKGLEGYQAYFGNATRLDASESFHSGWESITEELENDFPEYNKAILRKHNLYPDHRLLSGHIAVTGVKGVDKSIYAHLENGNVKVRRPGVKRITRTGIIFGDSDEETPVDVIIFATGYRYAAGFLDPKVIDLSYNKFERMNSEIPLHHFIYPVDSPDQIYTNCGFIAYAQGNFQMQDLQAQHFVLHCRGLLELPSNEKMQQITAEKRKYIADRYYESPRHGTQYALDIDFYDDLAKEIGCHPCLISC